MVSLFQGTKRIGGWIYPVCRSPIKDSCSLDPLTGKVTLWHANPASRIHRPAAHRVGCFTGQIILKFHLLCAM